MLYGEIQSLYCIQCFLKLVSDKTKQGLEMLEKKSKFAYIFTFQFVYSKIM